MNGTGGDRTCAGVLAREACPGPSGINRLPFHSATVPKCPAGLRPGGTELPYGGSRNNARLARTSHLSFDAARLLPGLG
jgi:hypothetical protein